MNSACSLTGLSEAVMMSAFTVAVTAPNSCKRDLTENWWCSD